LRAITRFSFAQVPIEKRVIARKAGSLYVGSLSCLAIREDGRRGETDGLQRSRTCAVDQPPRCHATRLKIVWYRSFKAA
jgi:hypothetical protein